MGLESSRVGGGGVKIPELFPLISLHPSIHPTIHPTIHLFIHPVFNASLNPSSTNPVEFGENRTLWLWVQFPAWSK